jgi:hypothetical protein
MKEPAAMDPNAKPRSNGGDSGPVVRSEWSRGPRTPAWNRLWHAILSRLDPEPTTLPEQQLGREGDDG